MSGMNSVARGVVLTVTTLTAVVGLVLPAHATSTTDFPGIHRIRPVVSMRQCQQAGGWVEATRQGSATCRGGIDDGDPVNIS
jgi:hypothetical protein